MSYIGTIAAGFRTLLTGMGITARHAPKKNVTLQYPHEKPELSQAYRSLIQLKVIDDLETHDCVACMQCVKICPSFCIEIEGGKVEGMKRKRATKFEVDFALCSLCGLCIDTCPTDTLEYSRYYDEADGHREWTYDLLEPFEGFEAEFRARQKVIEEKQAAARAEKAAKAKAAKEAAEKKKAEAEAEAMAAADPPAEPESDAAPPDAATPEEGGER